MSGSIWPSLIAGAKARASEVESKFDWIEGDVVPMTGGTKTDATYDLGQSSSRWRDIYFSRQILAPAGSASVPPYAYVSGVNTGIFFPSTTQGAATGNGGEAFRWGSGQFLAEDGSVGAPSISFINSTAMGFYRIANNNLGGAVAGVKFMDVSSAGEISWPLQPAFLAYNNTADLNQTGQNEEIQVEFDTEVFDQNSDFNNTTDTFTAPVTGRYLLSASVDLSGYGGAVRSGRMTIVTSNRTYRYSWGNNAQSSLLMNITVVADMDAADTAIVNTLAFDGATGVDIGGVSSTLITSNFSGILVA